MNTPVTKRFLSMADWQLVFYGSSAAVFVNKKTVKQSLPLAVGDQIDKIKNIKRTLVAFDFSLQAKDLVTANRIVYGIQERFTCPNHHKMVQSALHFYHGNRAYYDHQFLQYCHAPVQFDLFIALNILHCHIGA